jgi:hypothetical protein
MIPTVTVDTAQARSFITDTLAADVLEYIKNHQDEYNRFLVEQEGQSK